MSDTPILDKIQIPDDMRNLSIEALDELAEEIRQDMIEAVSKTGGHLGAGLGVVELTVALHYVFNAPEDRIIWDVGHQSYPHKILTERRKDLRKIRQPGGISGFTKRSESIYDPFGTGHSSTSISAALGMAVGRDKKGDDNEVIAVIGDGAMSAGMAFEALNNAGSMNTRLIVILNDNDMSIAPPVGAMSDYLSRLISSHSYFNIRHILKQIGEKFPKSISDRAKKVEAYAKGIATGGTLFEELGFYYVGPVDGHNLKHLVPVLKNIKNEKDIKPVLIHVVTQKGKGFSLAEEKDDKCHSIGKFDPDTGLIVGGSKKPSFTDIFAKSLIKEAENDDKIMAITAAMPSGTGICDFADKFPERTFDVGIAEQHAVTFAAGLACEGWKPFVAIYSTFLQRAYDQVVHDVCLQRLPVRFAIDRAGFVGADGPTHEGTFDIAFLINLPNMVLMCPSDEHELERMVETAALIDDRPCAFRYPRGEIYGLDISEKAKPVEIGKGRIIKQGKNIAVLSLGTRLQEVLKASAQLEKKGINITIADARFAKPLDEELVMKLANEHETLITIEEGRVGGFGSFVMDFLAKQNLLNRINFRPLTIPDYFMEHNTQDNMYNQAGLDSKGIVKTVMEFVEAEEEIKQYCKISE